MFAEEIRRQAEVAPQAALPAVTAALWRAYGQGKITEVEAEALSGLIEARTDAPASRRLSPIEQAARGPSPTASPPNSGSPARRSVGSRPRTEASLERRRRWAASGRLPPGLAARFTLAEQAVLALVAAETVRRKDCCLSVGGMAAIAGVSETTVRNAIREAVRLGFVTVEERRITGWRNDTNVVRIVSPEWTAWLRLTRKRKDEAPALPAEGGGCKSAKGTPTDVLDLKISRPAAPPRGLPRGSGRPDRMRATGNRGAR